MRTAAARARAQLAHAAAGQTEIEPLAQGET